jgi:flagellar export protein FliJ
MAAFRFRAGAALDLRQEQERAALTALGRAEARFYEVKTTLEAESDRRTRAETDLVALERRGSDLATLLWHRNWIVRLSVGVDRLRRDLEDEAAAVRQARGAWQEARRRRLALDRMKDRAWRRFQQAERRDEMKALDELARIRHVMSDSWRNEL